MAKRKMMTISGDKDFVSAIKMFKGLKGSPDATLQAPPEGEYFVIDGIYYRKRLVPLDKQPNKDMRNYAIVYAFGLELGIVPKILKSINPLPKNIDILAEYAKCVKKRSRLSSYQRKWVNYLFQVRYEQIV